MPTKSTSIATKELREIREQLYPRTHEAAGRPRPGPLDKLIGRRIKERREHLGMTQEQLGEFIGMSYQQVRKYEAGENRIPASRLFHFARVLHAEPGWFMDWPGAKAPN